MSRTGVGMGVLAGAMLCITGCATAPVATVSSTVLPLSQISITAPNGTAVRALPTEAIDQPVPRSKAVSSTKVITLPPVIVTARPVHRSPLGLLLRGQVAGCPGCDACTLSLPADRWRFETHEHEFVFYPSLIFGRADNKVMFHLLHFEQESNEAPQLSGIPR